MPVAEGNGRKLLMKDSTGRLSVDADEEMEFNTDPTAAPAKAKDTHHPSMLEDTQHSTFLQEFKVEKDVDNVKKYRRFGYAWLGFLVMIYIVLTALMTNLFLSHKQEAMATQAAILDPNAAEKGKTASQESISNATNASIVSAGFYIDGVTDVSIVDSKWSVNFYLWFRWTNSSLNPGKTFQIIDGDVDAELAPEELEWEERDGLFYSLYRVKGHMIHFFDVIRFPNDDHLLTLRIEDRELDHEELLYVVDEENSKVSSRVNIPGYCIAGKHGVSKLHAYKSTRGNPWADTSKQINYSQLIAALQIVRCDAGVYIVMFQGVFAAVFVSFASMLISPASDARFDLGIGGFFAVVAATYISVTQLPMTGSFTLTDAINGISMFTVFMTIAHSFMARLIFEKLGKINWFDFCGLAIFVIGSVTCIVSSSAAAKL